MSTIFLAYYRIRGKDLLSNTQHVHNSSCELLLIHNGKGSFLSGDRLYPFDQNRIFFIRPMCFHSSNPSIPEEYERSVLSFKRLPVETILNHCGYTGFLNNLEQNFPNEGFVPNKEHLFEYFALFKRAGELYDESTRINSEAIEIEYISIVMRALTLTTEAIKIISNNPVSSAHVKENAVLEYINSHLTDRLTTDSIASACHISRYYLCRQFRSATGTTIMRYILEQRLNMAKHLLIETDISINNIFELCGFSTFSYFCHAFRDKEHCTPSQFRRSNTVNK